MKPWEMILAHRYEEAASMYQEKLRSQTEDSGLLSAHATAMLGLGRLEEALDGFIRANALASAQLKGETQPYLKTIGAILWLLRKHDESIQTFKMAVDGIADGSIKFADNAGGVSQGLLLWCAGVSTADEEVKNHSLRYLRNVAKKSRIKYWPGVLGLFLLGKKTNEEVIQEVCGTSDLDMGISRFSTDLLKRRGLVKALFYFAVRKRDEGDEQGCRATMAKCASLENPVLEEEWFLADAESKSR